MCVTNGFPLAKHRESAHLAILRVHFGEQLYKLLGNTVLPKTSANIMEIKPTKLNLLLFNLQAFPHDQGQYA